MKIASPLQCEGTHLLGVVLALITLLAGACVCTDPNAASPEEPQDQHVQSDRFRIAPLQAEGKEYSVREGDKVVLDLELAEGENAVVSLSAPSAQDEAFNLVRKNRASRTITILGDGMFRFTVLSRAGQNSVVFYRVEIQK